MYNKSLLIFIIMYNNLSFCFLRSLWKPVEIWSLCPKWYTTFSPYWRIHLICHFWKCCSVRSIYGNTPTWRQFTGASEMVWGFLNIPGAIEAWGGLLWKIRVVFQPCGRGTLIAHFLFGKVWAVLSFRCGSKCSLYCWFSKMTF